MDYCKLIETSLDLNAQFGVKRIEAKNLLIQCLTIYGEDEKAVDHAKEILAFSKETGITLDDSVKIHLSLKAETESICNTHYSKLKQ